MAAPLRIALAQIDTTVGDIAGNVRQDPASTSRAPATRARSSSCSPSSRSPATRPRTCCSRSTSSPTPAPRVERLAAETSDIVALVGFPERAEDVYNAAAVLAGGEVRGDLPQDLPAQLRRLRRGALLPGRAPAAALIEVGDAVVGLTICEDIWEPGPPLSDEALAGATVVINLSASPYYAGKGGERENMLVQRARDSLAAVAFCNLVGGQDELVFDGHSVVVDHDGAVIARAHQFGEELLVATIDPEGSRASRLRDTRHRPAARRMQAEVDHLAELPRPNVPAGRRRAARGRSPRSCPATPRSTRRSSSGSTTTWSRTGSATSCSGSRAGSTRRSWPAWPATPSGPSG